MAGTKFFLMQVMVTNY